MAPDVIDLISSSPSPPKKQQEPPLVAQDGGRSKRPTLPQPQSDHPSNPAPFYLSDEFDMTDDDADFLGIDVRSSKRLRLSASPPASGAIKTNASSRPTYKPTTRPVQPPLRNIASERTNRLVFDPIEFTSSIEVEAPESRQNRPAQTTRKSAQLPALLSISSDPFASSPPPAPAPAFTRKPKSPSKNIASDEFSNPLVSSPNTAVAEPVKPQTERRATSFDVAKHRAPRRCNDWDPISSSAPEPSPRRLSPKTAVAGPTVINIDSDSQDGSDDDEFPDIANFDVTKFRPRPRSPLRRSHSEIVSSKTWPKSTNTTTTKKTVEQRARERETRTAEKAVEKERKRQEKELVKEAKAREKERAAALAEVNKIRTDKKVSTPEMIVLTPSNIDPGLKVQVETLLDGLNVEHTSWECPAGNAFKWRRKVTSRFDEEMGRWEPIPLQIKTENHALIILAADELVDLAINNGLDSNVNQTKGYFPSHEIIYILEGMTAWMRKNRNIRNRQFASGVRSQGASSDAAAPSRGRRRNNAASEEHISEDLIEDAMLRLQVEHDVLIHHTAAPLETAQWIVAFTQHISTIPYKKQRDQATATAGFCMESGQVRTGDDTKDTYVRMLQEIARVTAPIAYGIAAEFDSVSKLVDGLENGGPGTLEGVRKGANKDGALSDRTVGQAVSKRIFKVFTGRDEMSTDV